jgi:histidinol dehydrogenase
MLYMLAVPAAIAEVPRIIVATPPLEDGSVDPACLVAARLCGVHEVYRVGGAQAVAALAYGTESIQPVVKISGPGSSYVAAAKRVVGSHVDAGLPAGPSESIILSDETGDPATIALDLLTEAEHGADSAALLITPSDSVAEQVTDALPTLIRELPEPRKSFVLKVLTGYGGVITTKDMDTAIEAVNKFAPEHLQIRTKDPFETLSGIRNAGEILLGGFTPFTLANYATGANAVLPTGGKAKTWSAVSVRDFIKYSSVVYVSANGFDQLKTPAVTLADYEGFPAHSNALKLRGL